MGIIPGKLGSLTPTGTYSKLGAPKPGTISSSHIPSDTSLAVGASGLIGAEMMRMIKNDWDELALDLTQLGLTIVGLLDIAPPAQAAADVTNGGIDFARGHPIIGVLSMASTIPILGLLPGVGLTVVRVVKCCCSGFKLFGKVVYAIVTTVAKPAFQFVVIKGKQLFSYIPEAGKIVEGAKAFSKNLIEAIERIVKKLMDIDPKMIEPIQARPTAANRAGNTIRQNPTTASQQKIQYQVQTEYGKYRTYPYNSLGKGQLWK